MKKASAKILSALFLLSLFFINGAALANANFNPQHHSKTFSHTVVNSASRQLSNVALISESQEFDEEESYKSVKHTDLNPGKFFPGFVVFISRNAFDLNAPQAHTRAVPGATVSFCRLHCVFLI